MSDTPAPGTQPSSSEDELRDELYDLDDIENDLDELEEEELEELEDEELEDEEFAEEDEGGK